MPPMETQPNEEFKDDGTLSSIPHMNPHNNRSFRMADIEQ